MENKSVEKSKDGRIKMECKHCQEEFEIEDYAPDKTFCPYCGLASGLVTKEQSEKIDPVGTVPKKKTKLYECNFCKIRWTAKLGSVCPNCKRQTDESIIVEV